MKFLNYQMKLKNETKEELMKLLDKGYITQESFNDFFRHSNNTTLKRVIESQFNLGIEQVKTFVYELFTSWKNTNEVLHHNEIVIINILINKKGTMTRKELEKKSKMSKSSLSIALKLLEEEGAICSMNISSNGRLIYVNQDYVRKMLKKKNGK